MAKMYCWGKFKHPENNFGEWEPILVYQDGTVCTIGTDETDKIENYIIGPEIPFPSVRA